MEQSRRNFIINNIKILTASFGLLTFSRYFSFSQTTTSHIKKPAKEIKTLLNNTSTNYLVTYESQFGSTKEIAETIGKVLSQHGNAVDVMKINDVKNLSGYSSIVIGSAIQYDKWMSEAREFIIKNEKSLSKKVVNFFLVCLTLSKKSDKNIQKANTYATKTKKLVPTIKVNSFGKFAGVLNYSKMPFAQRILAKGIFAIIGVKEGDYRDWEAIRSWVGNIDY